MISLGGVIGQGLFLSAGGNLYQGGKTNCTTKLSTMSLKSFDLYLLL